MFPLSAFPVPFLGYPSSIIALSGRFLLPGWEFPWKEWKFSRAGLRIFETNFGSILNLVRGVGRGRFGLGVLSRVVTVMYSKSVFIVHERDVQEKDGGLGAKTERKEIETTATKEQQQNEMSMREMSFVHQY